MKLLTALLIQILVSPAYGQGNAFGVDDRDLQEEDTATEQSPDITNADEQATTQQETEQTTEQETQGTETQETTNQNTATQNTATQNTATQNTATQNTATQYTTQGTGDALNDFPGAQDTVQFNDQLNFGEDQNGFPVNEVQATEPAPGSGADEATSEGGFSGAPAAGGAEIAGQLTVSDPLPPPNEFAGAPPVPGGIRNMAASEAPEIYEVQYGDTLFDICDQLLDEPAFWPKLWSLNPQIKNPHFIYPKMQLVFYPGDDATPPYLKVVAEEDMIPIDKGNLEEEVLIEEPVDVAEEIMREDNEIEVLKDNELELDPSVEDLFIAGGKIYKGNSIEVRLPGFLYVSEREPLGYVVVGREAEQSLAPGQEVLIENELGLTTNSTYSALRYSGEVSNPESGETVGYLYYFVGNLAVSRALQDDPDVFIAKVLDVQTSVRPGDLVVSYISTRRTLTSPQSVGGLSSAKANVVAFEALGKRLGGEGQFAFIDSGTGSGVSPGMYLEVFQTPGYIQIEVDNLPMDYQAIGVMKIIDVTDAGAVGYIVKSSRELRLGDRVGGA